MNVIKIETGALAPVSIHLTLSPFYPVFAYFAPFSIEQIQLVPPHFQRISGFPAGGSGPEIDIATQEGFEGRGFATACTTAFIKTCLARGLMPSWSCWPFREASIALAKKLGFEAPPDVSAHYWTENM